MRKNKWYWVIGVMTAVALGITLDMYYHTARKQRGELLSLIAVIVSIFTLAATIFIALYIYNKGKNDAEQNEKTQKHSKETDGCGRSRGNSMAHDRCG